MPKAARRTSGPEAAPSARSAPHSRAPAKKAKSDKENVDPENNSPSGKQGNYLDVEIEEVKGEVPCYDNAATVRRKLNKLINDKVKIPGSNKQFNKASMADQMQQCC